VLIPDVTDRKAADWTLETAQRLLRPVTRGKVEGLVGGADPFESVKEAVHEGDFDEIIISTLPKRVSKWLRRDLIGASKGWVCPSPRSSRKRPSSRREEQLELGLGGGIGGGLP
jgi:hypothetical protein